MGKAESKELVQDDQYIEIRKIAETKGPAEVLKYLKENMSKWKEETVTFGVTGRTATGKSTFINKIRDVKPNDPGFAKSGSGNTTLEPTAYENPQNKRIVFYDLPGVGTLEFPKETYVSKMALKKYDYFFIFFNFVVCEDDYFLVCELLKLNKSFCLIRSKIDEDLRNAEEDGKIAASVLPAIRKQINEQIACYDNLRNTDALFLISSRVKDTGDWFKLVEHIKRNLPAPKYESFMFSLPTLTKEVIDLKYRALEKRVKIATVAAASVAAIPIPGIDLVANIAILVEEVLHYIRVFGLGKKKLDTLEGFDRNQLNCAGFLDPGVDMGKVILMQLGKLVAILAVESVADIFLPIIGSIISAGTSAVFTYRYLSRTLRDFRDDAVVVYRFVLQSSRV
ncbi:interferon-inducible GTPase 5-like [Mytilus galloprovincialis]|uniref:interferon-inducible GTPase 5-like n=1 Tax=Mytilus galloprovincialis TaxID=29158 RepID=UPI003F7CC7FE